MNRRAVLVAAPAALFPASLVSAMPEAETPVQQIYREWKRAFDHASVPKDLDEDEGNRRIEVYLEIEKRLDAEPSRTMTDLALIMWVACGDWCFAPCPASTPGLCADIMALVEVKA